MKTRLLHVAKYRLSDSIDDERQSNQRPFHEGCQQAHLSALSHFRLFKIRERAADQHAPERAAR